MIEEIEQILEKAAHAAVLIDEAYFEFCGVTALGLIDKYPNLFVSRTFSKVFGMAAMRMGCLFSQAANIAYLQKCQSPYSVNMLAAWAAEAAVGDPEYIKNYTLPPRLSPRARCCGPDSAASASCRRKAQRTSSSAISVRERSKSAMPCAKKQFWCATAATKFPVVSA